MVVTMSANPSAMGAANKIPSIPKKSGRMRISGTKKMTWRDKDRNTPLIALPVAAKKLEEIICTPLMTTINKKILMNLTAKSK